MAKTKRELVESGWRGRDRRAEDVGDGRGCKWCAARRATIRRHTQHNKSVALTHVKVRLVDLAEDEGRAGAP